MADIHNLLIEEQALHEQEQGLIEMEEQLHAQEQGVAQMERAFTKRNKTLLNLVSYVDEQETNLLKRAAAIGPKAKELVREMLGSAEDAPMGATSGVGKPKERGALLERRQELLAARMELVEEREGLYGGRYEEIEKAENAIADVEQKLLRREREISEALRELIAASSSLMGDEDEDEDEDGDDDDDDAHEQPEEKPPPGGGAAQHVVESDSVGREPVRVVGGATKTDEHAGGKPEGVNSRTEDEVTRRRKGRARARTNQFRITLEAHLDAGEPHEFFSYKNDTPEDLPGLFIATPNLLKVGREVRVRVGMAGSQLEATGVVAWRRQRGEAGGPPGMGIELLNLSDGERTVVQDWVTEHEPVVV